MKVNYKMIVISSIVTAVAVSVLLKFVGNPMGIPAAWNPGIAGGIAAATSSVLGQIYAKEDEAS